jgi:hypothetical protein
MNVSFEGCGIPTLLRFLDTGSVFSIKQIERIGATHLLVKLEKASDEVVDCQLLDINGRARVINVSTGNVVLVDVSTQPSGTYYLRLSLAGHSETRRVVIAH